jgi:hypothetical protein
MRRGICERIRAVRSQILYYPPTLSLKGHIMLSIKALKSKVSSIKSDAKSLRGRIQTVLVHTAGHAYQHRDVTMFTELYAATSGVNRKRMVKFIQENCFATLQKDGSFKLNKSAVKNADFDDGDAVVEYLSDQDAWYVDEEQAPAIVKALTPAVLLEQLADKIENPKVGQDVVVDFAAYNAAMQRVDAAIQARIAG